MANISANKNAQIKGNSMQSIGHNYKLLSPVEAGALSVLSYSPNYKGYCVEVN